MKKLFIGLFFIFVCISNWTYCFALDEGELEIPELSLIADLDELKDVETEVKYTELNNYYIELKEHLQLQENVISSLESLHNLGFFYNNFNIIDLKTAYSWENDLNPHNKLIFVTDYYEDYYKYRLELFEKENTFIKFNEIDNIFDNSSEVYDLYVQTNTWEKVDNNRLVLLLQDYLLDKLKYFDKDMRDAFVMSVLNLRKDENIVKQKKYIYQLFESRVRIKLLEGVIQRNKLKIDKATQNIKIKLDNFINVEFESKSYNKTVPLKLILLNKDKNISVRIIEETFNVPMQVIWECLSIHNSGYLNISFEEIQKKISLYTEFGNMEEKKNINNTNTVIENLESQLKYYGYTAKHITGQLDMYDIFNKSFNQDTNNSYTINFFDNINSWKKDVSKHLYLFSTDERYNYSPENIQGIGNYVLFIRDFLDYSRKKPSSNIFDSKVILDFRVLVLCFKPVEEANLWILDILYQSLF